MDRLRTGWRRWQWNRQAGQWTRDFHEDGLYRFTYGIVERNPSGMEEKEVVELMAGTAGHKGIATDFSPEMLKRNPSRHRVQLDANKPLPFADESMRGVAMVNGIWYTSDPQKLFQETHRILGPGGKMVIVGSEGLKYSSLQRNKLNPVELLRLLKQEGFQASYKTAIYKPVGKDMQYYGPNPIPHFYLVAQKPRRPA